jgi:hypothetical protein
MIELGKASNTKNLGFRKKKLQSVRWGRPVSQPTVPANAGMVNLKRASVEGTEGAREEKRRGQRSERNPRTGPPKLVPKLVSLRDMGPCSPLLAGEIWKVLVWFQRAHPYILLCYDL